MKVIQDRRSIREWTEEPVSEQDLAMILEAGRQAPSGENAQPWRFKVVRDSDTKEKLAHSAYYQSFIAQAPVVFVCCADIQGYLDGTASGIQDLGQTKAIDGRIVEILLRRTRQMEAQMKLMSKEQLGARMAFNVAIAVEHIVLRALDFGLGTCWVRLIDEQKVRELFGWGDNLFVVALLPVGYPDESPHPRRRLSVQELIIQ